MMNHEDNRPIEALAAAWRVDTADISQRVSAAIGATVAVPPNLADVLSEIHALRKEMRDFRNQKALLHEEILRLRLELTAPRVRRIAPYSGAEGLVRLS